MRGQYQGFSAWLTRVLIKIFLAVKYVLTYYNKQAIELPTSKQSALTSNTYILSNHTNETNSIIFGFSLFGLIGLDNSEKNRKLIDTIEKGILYLQNDDYDAFEQTLQEALKMANDSKNVEGITHVYNVLANGAFLKNEYEKAKVLFIKVVQRLIKQGSLRDDLNMLYLHLKLSKIYEIQKDYKICKSGYLYCMKKLEKKIKIDPENKDVLGLYAKTLDVFGHYFMMQGEIQKAIIILQKAYNASVKLYGEVFRVNIFLLNDLGNLYCVQGKLSKGLPCFIKAEKILENFPDSKINSAIYVKLANIFLQQGMLKEAEKYCVKGINNAKILCYNRGKEEAEICLAAIKKAMK
ncbi:hypothetical protein QTP88_020814 [Uroleucon formosanum]